MHPVVDNGGRGRNSFHSSDKYLTAWIIGECCGVHWRARSNQLIGNGKFKRGINIRCTLYYFLIFFYFIADKWSASGRSFCRCGSGESHAGAARSRDRDGARRLSGCATSRCRGPRPRPSCLRLRKTPRPLSRRPHARNLAESQSRIATIASISTVILPGSDPTPTAERECRPASPNTSTKRSEN